MCDEELPCVREEWLLCEEEWLCRGGFDGPTMKIMRR